MTLEILRYTLVRCTQVGSQGLLALFAVIMFQYSSNAQDDIIQVERNEMANLIEQDLWSEINLQNESVDGFYILTGHEKEWVLLMMGDFQGFFATLLFNEDYYESSKLERSIWQDYAARYFGIAEYYSTFDRLSILLQDNLNKKRSEIANNVLTQDLSEDQKRFVLLYLSYYAYQFDVCNAELVASAVSEFQKQQFESLDFSSFVIKYETTIAQLANRSMFFGMGLGANTVLQNPSNITTGFLFNFLFDYNFKFFHLGSRILIQQHRTKIAFESLPQYDLDRPFGLFYFDVYGGVNADLFDSKFIIQPYLGYGFGFFRGVNEVDEPNFSTTQVNSGFFGLKTQYVFNRKRLCEDILSFVNQKHYALFFDLSFRVRPFGSATPELLGHGLLFNIGVVINNPILKPARN